MIVWGNYYSLAKLTYSLIVSLMTLTNGEHSLI